MERALVSTPATNGPEVLVPFSGPVLTGALEQRYKRFFVDVTLDEKGPAGTGRGRARRVTAHTPNTGAMTGLLERGARVLLTYDASPTRKLAYTLQAIEVSCGDGQRTWVGTNTLLPNRLVEAAITSGLVRELGGYRSVRREVKYGREGRSRVDLLLDAHRRGRPPCYVEVKSVTLREGRMALFPDAVSERGQKHLHELAARAKAGDRAAIVYVAQRTDCAAFGPAERVDPAYADALHRAKAAGVVVLCLVAAVEPRGVRVVGRLPVKLSRRRR